MNIDDLKGRPLSYAIGRFKPPSSAGAGAALKARAKAEDLWRKANPNTEVHATMVDNDAQNDTQVDETSERATWDGRRIHWMGRQYTPNNFAKQMLIDTLRYHHSGMVPPVDDETTSGRVRDMVNKEITRVETFLGVKSDACMD